METFPDPDEGFELLPSEDEDLDEAGQLEAAAEDALDDPFEREEVADPPVPLGQTWEFDFDRGRFRRQGLAPAVVTGEHSLHQWLLAAAQTAPGAHPIFSDDYGTERWWEPLGGGAMEASEAISDMEERLREAWTQHDRVSDVTNLDARYDAVEGIVYIENVDVILDEDERVRLGPLALATVPG